MRHLFWSLILLTLLAPGMAIACFNLTSTDLDGKSHHASRHQTQHEFIRQLTHRRPKLEIIEKIDELRRKSTANPDDLDVQNDLAVYLARVGELSEALKILKKIEETKPGLYNTAANLGTVYELKGDVENAIHWIRTGIARNPESHEGSEWLHVRILEVKQQLDTDPDWLKTHSVLGLDFGEEPTPRLPESFEATGEAPTLETLTQHLGYQLGERVPLVDPPDSIVGDLLFDYANCKALSGDVELATALLDLAESYGAPQTQVLTTRRSYFRTLTRWSYAPIIAAVVIVMFAFGLAGLFLPGLRRRLSRKSNANPSEPHPAN